MQSASAHPVIITPGVIDDCNSMKEGNFGPCIMMPMNGRDPAPYRISGVHDVTKTVT